MEDSLDLPMDVMMVGKLEVRWACSKELSTAVHLAAKQVVVLDHYLAGMKVVTVVVKKELEKVGH